MRGITDDFTIKVIEPSQVTINPDGTTDAAYNKVSIEAVVPDGLDYSEVIGMTYALDVRKPMVKFFRCLKSNTYEHLVIDNDNFITNQTLDPESNIDYRPLDRLLEADFHMEDFISAIKGIDFHATNANVNFKLGQWIRFAINFSLGFEYGKVKIATNDIISGYKQLFEDSNSDFFRSLGAHHNYMDIYQSFASVIYDSKDIVNVVDKTRLLKDILSL